MVDEGGAERLEAEIVGLKKRAGEREQALM